MTARALSGSAMSALFMAGAVLQILSAGIDRGLPRAYSLAVAVLFAVNPMIVFYGSNGMSEAPFIFFMSWAVRRLILWMADDDVHHRDRGRHRHGAGLSHPLRRRGVHRRRRPGGRDHHLSAGAGSTAAAPGLLDLLMVSGPGTAAFLGWAVISWLITGEAFAQFTSQYGNAAILEQSGQQAPTFGTGVGFALACIFLMAPTLLPIATWALVRRRRQSRWQVLIVPVAIFGAALTFQALSYATGSTFPFLRFYIIAVPLTAFLAVLAVPDGMPAVVKRRGRYAPPPRIPDPGRHSRFAYLPVLLALAICVPFTAWG